MLVCGICKNEKPRSGGLIFHACEECWHGRLFICKDCRDTIAIQQSLHEICSKCIEHLSPKEFEDFEKDPNTCVSVLAAAIEDFERSHATLFDMLPASTDPDCVHPGSGHPNLKKWREKYIR